MLATPGTRHALRKLTVNTLAAAGFLLTHASNLDRGNGSLRFVYGTAGHLDMTKLLPVIFAVAACGAHQGSLLGRRRSVCGVNGWTRAAPSGFEINLRNYEP